MPILRYRWSEFGVPTRLAIGKGPGKATRHHKEMAAQVFETFPPQLDGRSVHGVGIQILVQQLEKKKGNKLGAQYKEIRHIGSVAPITATMSLEAL